MANKTAKQNAKIGTRSKAAPAEEFTASSIVMITGNGHKVSKDTQIVSDCGRPRVGWRFGSIADVTCKHCLDGEHYTVRLIEVPPIFPDEWYADDFDVQGHHANDGDSVPILCYECGEEWPCRTVVSTLPVADMSTLTN